VLVRRRHPTRSTSRLAGLPVRLESGRHSPPMHSQRLPVPPFFSSGATQRVAPHAPAWPSAITLGLAASSLMRGAIRDDGALIVATFATTLVTNLVHR
jgi:hypothetical protein